MAEDAMDLCLDNLDEFVNDENKLVTYKWLSLTLSINVNQAKQLLFTFVVNQRNKKENESLCVTYVVSGLTKADGSNGSHKVQIVPEEMLESVKSSFSVVTSCHVYSVRKGKLKDTNTLYMTDYEALKQNLYKSNQFSAISCPAAILRDEDQMDKLAQVKPTNVPAKKSNEAVQAPPPSAKSKKPAGIAGMFAKAPSKPSKEAEKRAEEPAETTNQKNGQKEAVDNKKSKDKGQKPGVMSFFAKQATKPKSEVKSAPATVQDSEKTEPKQKESREQSPEKPQEEKPSIKNTKRGIKHKVHSEDEESQNAKQKKRKRIKVQIDSSSEDEEMEVESPIPSPAPPEPEPEPEPTVEVEEEEEEEPIPAEEATRTSPAPSPKKRAGPDETDMCGKVKKRKLVSKTFVNDEGFMVTEKVWEDEWEDAPPDPPKNTKSSSSKDTSPKSKKTISPAKKISPNKATSGKQTSLMNFFKKK